MSSAKRELFKSPDVCEMAQLQPYVLRSWEAEFPGLGQATSGGRIYRRADVELVLRIRQLVFVEGLTLAGARRRLEEEQAEPSMAALSVDDVLGDMAKSRLRQVRTGLEAILQLLSRDAASSRGPELQLVAPSGGDTSRTRRTASRNAAGETRTTAKGSAGKRSRAS
jgi:DNA-binding transcriptional MerR regulator